jgi:hypothetical protein
LIWIKVEATGCFFIAAHPAVSFARLVENCQASMICRLVSSQNDGLKAIAALRCLLGMLGLLAKRAIMRFVNRRDPKKYEN